MVHGAAALPEVHLQEGDILCVGARPDATGLSLLLPRTFGHPMVGRSLRQRLLALPSGVPCDPARWRVAGAVLAVWRRGLAETTLALRGEPGPGAAPLARAVCVRVSQAALRLARQASPSLIGRPVAFPSERGSLLGISSEACARGVLPGMSAQDAVQRCPELALVRIPTLELERLVRTLLAALGDGARVVEESPEEVRILARLPVSADSVGAMVRGLAGLARVPLSVAVADTEPQAESAARALGPDELLYLLPHQAAQPVARAHTLAAGLPQPQVQAPARSPWASRPSPRPAAPGQLCLFGGEKAA